MENRRECKYGLAFDTSFELKMYDQFQNNDHQRYTNGYVGVRDHYIS